MKLAIIFCLCFISMPLGIAFCDQCNGTIGGLYEQRQALEKNYAKFVGKNYDKEKADFYAARIEKIDEKYRAVILNVLFKYEAKDYAVVRRTCSAVRCDPHLFFVCKLLDYKTSGNSQEFLKDLPTDRKDVKDLFKLDPIIFKYPFYENQPHPEIFERESFVEIFLRAIYELTAKGDPLAIDKFLNIFRYAEGDYGEYMDERLLRLFAEHPYVVLKNWKQIREYQSIINFATTSYSDQANNIISRYEDICTGTDYPDRCEEVIEFLKTRKQEIKKKGELRIDKAST